MHHARRRITLTPPISQSIVAENDDGTIYHARNLDYGIPGLQNLTATIEFKSGNVTQYVPHHHPPPTISSTVLALTLALALNPTLTPALENAFALDLTLALPSPLP